MRTEQPTKCLYHISYGGFKTSLSPPPVIHWWPFRAGGSDVVSVACFGVRVSVIFHLIIVQYTFSSVWVAECPLFFIRVKSRRSTVGTSTVRTFCSTVRTLLRLVAFSDFLCHFVPLYIINCKMKLLSRNC